MPPPGPPPQAPHQGVPLWARDEGKFVAGQLGHSADMWERCILPRSDLNAEQRADVLSWLRDGVDPTAFFKPYAGTFMGRTVSGPSPPPLKIANHPVPTELQGFVREEIARLISTGAVRRLEVQPHCCLPLAVEPTKPRLVWDGRYLNFWCNAPTVRFDGLPTFRKGIRPHDYLIGLDLHSGYHQVRVKPGCEKWFGFEYEGAYYGYASIPFGWNVAPYLFSTLTTLPMQFLRSYGYHGLVFIDDFSVVISGDLSPEQRHWVVWRVTALLWLCGFFVSKKKCTLVPTRTLRLLGFVVDVAAQQFRVPQDKITDLLALVRAATARDAMVTIPALQRLVGKAQSMSLAAPPVSIFLRTSWDLLAKAQRRNTFRLRLPEEARDDLLQLRALSDWSGLSVWPSGLHLALNLPHVLETDASSRAWGAALFMGGDRFLVGAEFTEAERQRPIHILELWAVKRALTTLGHRLRACYLDVFTDNEIVRHALARGAPRDPEIRAFAKELLAFQLQHGIIVRVHRITTADNVTADWLSRLYPEGPTDGDARDEHMLAPHRFKELQAWTGGTLTLDACASPGNNLLPRYITRFPVAADGCVAVDVLSCAFVIRPGVREVVYAHPPWPLIAPLWAHLRECEAAGVMVVPDLPSQPWFGMLKAEARACFRISFPGEHNVLFQRSRGYRGSVGPCPWGVLAFRFDFC